MTQLRVIRVVAPLLSVLGLVLWFRALVVPVLLGDWDDVSVGAEDLINEEVPRGL